MAFVFVEEETPAVTGRDTKPSLLLGLDTTTDQTGVALEHGDAVLELSWPANRRQTETLLEQIHRLLGLIDADIRAVSGIAVATGPGQFTALRVGVSTAKGFALALDLPVIGVPSLHAVAFPAIDPLWTTVAMLSAGRNRLVWQPFAPAVSLEPLAPPRNTTPAELSAWLATTPGPVRLAGNPGVELPELDPERIRVAPRGLQNTRPAAMIALTRNRFARGEHDDIARLEPEYLGR